MRVPQLRRDVEPKVRMERDDVLPQADVLPPRLPVRHFEQQGIQRRLQFLLDVLQQTGDAVLDALLQYLHVVGVDELDHLQVVPLLQLLDPVLRLALGIDEEGVAHRVVHDYGVLDGERVVGEAVDAPLLDAHLHAQDFQEGVVLRGGDLQALE